jgi:hypothetical protein
MKNIEVIATSIDVSDIQREVELNKGCWQDYTSALPIPFMQTQSIAIIGPGNVDNKKDTHDDFFLSNEYCPTKYYSLFPVTVKILTSQFENLGRVGFVKLGPGNKVTPHVDRGEYFHKHKRYHLVIQGEYDYFVGDESVRGVPGMLFTFNNHVMHWSHNVGNNDRIIIIFDEQLKNNV